MAHESSVRAGSGVSVLREGLVPGYPQAIPGMRGTNNVVVNYEDINSMLGVVQTSGLVVTTDAVQVAGPATRLRGRRQLSVQNLGSPNGAGDGTAYIGGDASVTASNGLQVPSGTTTTLNILDVGDVYIVSADVSDVRVVELK